MYRFLLFLAITIVLSQAEISKNRFENNIEIVGGRDAKCGEAPYQVSLMVKKNKRHLCGGSILTARTILTAAHCVNDYDPSELTILVGTNTLDNGGDKYEAITCCIHPNWDWKNIHNDIGLVITKTPIKFKDLVKPIPIETHYIGEGVNVTLTGWGLTKDPVFPISSDFPNNLQIINLKTISFADCKRVMNKTQVFENEICTLKKRGEGACKYDSGGPLIANGKQVGIVSWGEPCAKGFPDVYTRISSFADWIKNNIIQ